MEKYKRSGRFKGQRAWFKQFSVKKSMKIDWRGQKPRISLGVSEESFSHSNKTYTAPKESGPTYIIMHSEEYIEVRMYRSGTSYWFISRNSLVRKQFKSKTYPNRDEAMYAYRTRILWLVSTALGEDREDI